MTEKILYQHGTLGALMAGLMDGTETIAHILKKGTLGLGTLHGLDGEVIFLDGVAYQGRSDGSVAQLDGSELTPYAAITDFTPDTSFSVSKTADGEQLKKDILVREAGENLFLAVKITGLFKNMHIRIMPKQEKPYRRLAKISGVAAAGFHLHFIDDTHTFGGHVMDFEVAEGKVEISRISSLVQHFPVDDPTFVHETIDYADLAAEIQQAE